MAGMLIPPCCPFWLTDISLKCKVVWMNFGKMPTNYIFPNILWEEMRVSV